jgi:hypothetical protein
VCHVADVGGERVQILAVCVPHHGHDQPLVPQIDRDAKMDAGLHEGVTVTHGRVHPREIAERVDDRACDEWQEGQASSPTDCVDILEVDLHRDERVRRDLRRPQQVGAGPPLHRVEDDDLVVRGGAPAAAVAVQPDHVGARHPPVAARTRDGGHVDTRVHHQPPYRRRQKVVGRAPSGRTQPPRQNRFGHSHVVVARTMATVVQKTG